MLRLTEGAIELISKLVKEEYIDDVCDAIVNNHLMHYDIPASKTECGVSVTVNLTKRDFVTFDPYQWNRVTRKTVDKLVEHDINRDYNDNVYLIKDDDDGYYHMFESLSDLGLYDDWSKLSIRKISIAMIVHAFDN